MDPNVNICYEGAPEMSCPAAGRQGCEVRGSGSIALSLQEKSYLIR